jgi:5-methylcytosine-specific restriction protein A
MSFRINADVGTTKRSKMTPRKALKIFEHHGGVCVLSGRRIGPRDDWYIEHIIALELGGADEESNMGPALYAYKANKDAADHKAAAKAKRNKQRHLGIRSSARPMPHGRNSASKVKFGGKIVDRITGEPWKSR